MGDRGVGQAGFQAFGAGGDYRQYPAERVADGRRGGADRRRTGLGEEPDNW
ncbi:hypothetical protein D3C81_2235560 [compost metagenome]